MADKNLENILRHIEKPSLLPSRQAVLKSKIVRLISSARREKFSYELLALRIQALAREIKISPVIKALLREKLLTLFPQPKPWFFGFRFRLKPLALATLGVFVFVMVFGIFGNPKVLEASPATYLSEFEGKVEILRRGRLITPTFHTRLDQRDIVRTHPGSKAVLEFPDDSVTRLAENSELRLRRIFVNPFDRTHTEVEVELLAGKLWARVFRAISEFSQFQVRASNVVSTAKNRAAFDVEIKKGKAKVLAVQNTIRVTVTGKKQVVAETTLVSGRALQVNNGKPEVITVPEKAKEEWISKNLEEDKKYLEELAKNDREERLKQASEAPVIPSTISQIFVRDPLEKEKAKIRASKARLAQAELLIEAGHTEEAKKLLSEFRGMVAEVASKTKALESGPPLQQYLEQEFKELKRKFSLILPDDPRYLLKEAISFAEVDLASNPAEVIAVKLGHAAEKIIEAQDLMASGKEKEAVVTLQSFTETVTEAVSEATATPEVAIAIESEKEDHLKLLEALSAEVKFIPPPVLTPGERRSIGLREMIAQVKKEVGEVKVTPKAEAIPLEASAEVPPGALAEGMASLPQAPGESQEGSALLPQVLDLLEAPEVSSLPETPSQLKAPSLPEASIQTPEAATPEIRGPETAKSEAEKPPEPKPLEEILRPRVREIKPDFSSGVTVITIEAVSPLLPATPPNPSGGGSKTRGLRRAQP